MLFWIHKLSHLALASEVKDPMFHLWHAAHLLHRAILDSLLSPTPVLLVTAERSAS